MARALRPQPLALSLPASLAMQLPFLAAPALLASALAAQAFSSPAGYVLVEGAGVHDYTLFKFSDLRWQQLDDTNVGRRATTVSRIAWRRDATSATNPAWIARTMDLQVVLADSVPAGAASEGFAANYLGAPTTAFLTRPVNLPDWTQPPTTTPAPFDLVLSLDAPWVYTGVHSFLWELQTSKNTALANYGNDFQAIAGVAGPSTPGTVIGSGCTPTGQTSPMSLTCKLTNQVIRFRAGYTVSGAPPRAPSVLSLDLVNSDLRIPGLCERLVAQPTVLIGLGLTDANGGRAFAIENIPFQEGLVGVNLFSQAVSFDPGQPGLKVALSNGRGNVFPATATNPTRVSRVYEYRDASGAMRTPSVWTGGIVTRLD